MPDLFGNHDRLETTASKGEAVSLFEAAAERIAYEGGFSLRCDDCGTVDDECFCHGATATRIPNEGGRNVAQVRAEFVHPQTAESWEVRGPGWARDDYERTFPSFEALRDYMTDHHGTMEYDAPESYARRVPVAERQTCGTCGAAFLAKPRTPATCNLCRAKVPG